MFGAIQHFVAGESTVQTYTRQRGSGLQDEEPLHLSVIPRSFKRRTTDIRSSLSSHFPSGPIQCMHEAAQQEPVQNKYAQWQSQCAHLNNCYAQYCGISTLLVLLNSSAYCAHGLLYLVLLGSVTAVKVCLYLLFFPE